VAASRSHSSRFLMELQNEFMPQSEVHLAPSMIADTASTESPIQALPGFSRELQLLLSCGGPRIQAAYRERRDGLLVKDLDWGLVFHLALWHRMLPLLYWNLTQSNGAEGASSVPRPASEAMHAGIVRNISESLRMTADLLSILDGMEEEGVVAVPYKGPILSARLYGNLSLRLCSDLDIVVRRADLRSARKVLLSLGYQPSVMLHAATEEFRVESRYSERFDRPGSVVELHWAFTNKDVAFPLNLEDLLPRLTTYQVSGRSIRVFSPDDTLLILCVHGAKHGWSRLEWICGVAELLHGGGIQWDEVLRRARETKSLRRLLLGLCVAHDLYGSPLPEDVKKAIVGDKQVGALARTVTASLFDGGDHVDGLHTFGTLDHDLFHFRLGDGFPDSFRYLVYRITTPSRPEEWSTVSLGKRSISLHSFTRPFGIISKLVPALWRRYGPSRSPKR